MPLEAHPVRRVFAATSFAAIHEERNHQGKENLILFPTQTEARKKKGGAVRCRERLGGLLKYYEREAA